jgi:DNA replication protein DnaC
MQPIATIAPKIEPGKNWETFPPAKARQLQRVSLNTLDTKHALVANAVQKAREWAARKNDGYEDASLILSGPNGVGKTHIARAIWWSRVYEVDDMEGYETPIDKFIMAADLLLQLSPTRNDNGLDVIPRIADLIGENPAMVIVDDIGKEQSLPYIGKDEQATERRARFFRFFDHCYSKAVSVIITTNLSLAHGRDSQFSQYIGVASFDRLSEMAPAGFMVGLQGVPSWRVLKSGRAN